jgi:FMN phosphatase YigB (HAD superfamily)
LTSWWQAIERHGIDQLVSDVIIYSFDVGYRKPEPENYEIALSRLGVATEHAAMIGDNEAADGEGPRSVGLRARVIKEGFSDGGESLAEALQWVLDRT